jgi:hypothetical protein
MDPGRPILAGRRGQTFNEMLGSLRYAVAGMKLSTAFAVCYQMNSEVAQRLTGSVGRGNVRPYAAFA